MFGDAAAFVLRKLTASERENLVARRTGDLGHDRFAFDVVRSVIRMPSTDNNASLFHDFGSSAA